MPPANDDFANAEVLSPSGGSFSGDTTGCTAEAPITPANVWFEFTPGSTGWYSFWLVFGTIANPSMDVYSGASLGALAHEDEFLGMCGDGPNQKRNTYLTGGVTYHLDLYTASPPGDDGTYTLHWSAYSAPSGGPSHDNISAALALTSDASPHTVTVTTVDSTMETNEFTRGEAEPGVWLKIDASGGVTPFTVELDFTATGFNPFVDLWGTISGFAASLPDWNLLNYQPGGFWPGDGTPHPAAATVTIDPADSDNGIFYLFVGDWDYVDYPCFVSPAQGSVSITYTIDGAIPGVAPAVGVARDHPIKMVYLTGHYDVAGIDGTGTRTWADYSPQFPDPAGEGDWSGYDYRYLFKIGDRFYLPFAAGTSYVEINVYVYSWAFGETDWTFEWSQSWSATGGVFPYSGSDWDADDWDASCDGENIYVGLTTTHNLVVACPGPSTTTGYYTNVDIFQGTTLGTWTSVGFATTEFYDSTGRSRTRISVCASGADAGNAYVAVVDSGLDPCSSTFRSTEFFVQGFGATNAIPTKTYVEEVFVVVGGTSGEVPNAYFTDFAIVNDGDDIQIICRLPENTGGPFSGFNETQISVFKPTGFSTLSQAETNSSTGTGWSFYYEDPVLQFATEDAFTKVVSPLWTETGGRRQRAIVANFSGFDDVIGLDADGVTLHHFHDNTDLDSTKLVDDGGVEASIDETGTGGYYIPGIYYDTLDDEYWAIYQNLSELRSSVATPACGVMEWKGVDFTAGGTGVLRVAQGPFEDDVFYVTANTTGDITAASRVIAIPICRDCMECA